ERESVVPSRSRTAIGSLVASPAENTTVRTAIRMSGAIVVNDSRKGRRRNQPNSRRKTSQNPKWISARQRISPHPPVPMCNDTHSWPKALQRLHRRYPDLESPEVEISRRPRRPPCGVLSFDVDNGHADCDVSGAERRDIDIKRIPDLQAGQKVLAQVEGE